MVLPGCCSIVSVLAEDKSRVALINDCLLVRLERKWSLIGACSGIIAGLVGITPAAGFVGSPSALAIGVITCVCCNLATKIKFWLNIDDALDVWAVHGVGGSIGAVMTGLFTDARVTSFDGLTEIPGGWINVGQFLALR